MKYSGKSILLLLVCLCLVSVLSSCSGTYYSAMEKVGVHKRDIMVDRVEAGRDSQANAQQEFKSALEQFDSIVKLEDTKSHYEDMLATMRVAEKSMDPVLQVFHDNVLFLKHNLNAQAIGSLQDEFTSLESQIGDLIESMNVAIASSNEFIDKIKT